MPEALVEEERRRWCHLLRMNFLLKNSDWCWFQSLDPLTGYLCFPDTFGKKKKKKKESVSPCCDFKWESYIKWPGLSKSPLDFYLDRPVDHYLLLLPPHVHLLIVESDLQPIPHPWPLVKSQLHWPLIKWKLTVVYFIHVSAHPYRLVEFMIIIVSTHALKSLKGNWLWVTSSDYLSILSSKVRNDLRSPTQLLTWCTLPSIVPPRVI